MTPAEGFANYAELGKPMDAIYTDALVSITIIWVGFILALMIIAALNRKPARWVTTLRSGRRIHHG